MPKSKNSDTIKSMVERTLKVKDQGTYYVSQNRTQTFNKNDLETLIDDIEALITIDILGLCYEIELKYSELNKNDPPELRTPSDVVLKNLIKKIKDRVKKKSKSS